MGKVTSNKNSGYDVLCNKEKHTIQENSYFIVYCAVFQYPVHVMYFWT